ncbi:LacI family DNA-binding transcriptional regulator [Paenibacillus hexagrammi]|uniref:LacI family DNA-binding transcriptional regulator n=1 Tax=Paenibacillus hexagrammi TaxID=2908839 RepID=A0ABY3SEE8_9BACL|nr:LacI family DNA-binding transcriptional regulator [Paenibacillus sp. YPD9-1]UJF32369.1 LacI family DNA-binding transcriptional regulator [Paenibacillus sp. YPD9-1]
MKKITLQTIAEHLNVSKALVSKALSNDPAVNDVTKEQIWKTAEELGYRIKSSKKAFPASRTGNLAVLMPRGYMNDIEYWGKVLGGIDAELSKHGFSMLLSGIDTSIPPKEGMPASIHENKADGVIVLGHIPQDYIDDLKARSFPFVLVDTNIQDPTIDHVLANNFIGAYQATNHLIQAGHKNLAFVGDVESAWSFAERLRGFEQAVRTWNEKAPYPVTTVRIEGTGVSGRGNYTSAEFSQTLVGHVRNNPPVTGLFCANDMIAIETQSILAQMGVGCPSEVSIIGFDDLALSELTQPKLTTVKVPKTEMGKTAVELILRRIGDPEGWPELVLLSTFLVERASVQKL